MAPVGAGLWRTLRAHQVYGANTDVGKTIVSTVLCNAVQRQKQRAAFLKPVSTGALDDADDRHIDRYGAGTLTKCLYQFDEPVSPHIAAKSKTIPRDNDLLASIHKTLSGWARTDIDFALVETAGGVHSPGPNGNSQADLYRPLRLPIVLVADSRLGGISSSISAYESLLLRGYDVQSVLLFRDDYYQNHDYLGKYFRNKSIPLVHLPAPPSKPLQTDADAQKRDEEAMFKYYRQASEESDILRLLEELNLRNEQRIEKLEEMADRAHDLIWYPFTQHQGMQAKDITVIDSAHDDYFQTFGSRQTQNSESELRPTFDGSASWWTQGLGHGNPDLALSAAYAAGRYGHVMFAGAVHEPALSLADNLLKTLDNPRFAKVFYTDNGSTGMEVAIKMGLRAACDRYGWDASQEKINILGLKGSYHGDTIGVMDCSEPSIYNKKVEWYRGRGHWFDFPLVKMVDGKWKVEVPAELQEDLGSDMDFNSLGSVFDLDQRLGSETSQRYKKYIHRTIKDLVDTHGMKFGALILEPVILGAGGMLFCDPLFQRCLTDVVREHPELFSSNAPAAKTSPSWSGLPVVFDEVFTGLYRLGRPTSASFLGVHPDIAVNAKLLTGGLIPLCTTTASKEIFDAFSSPEKSDALLHGHSYTAHAMGCTVAVDSLRTMSEMDKDGSWDEYRTDWNESSTLEETSTPEVWSVWSNALLKDLSCAESVESVFAIGTVLSISLRDEQGGGYTSNAAKGLQQNFRAGGDQFNVHSRVLGNVLYLMSSVTSKPESLKEMERLLRSSLT
ncbi:Pyridoxal phosphate-dependent transferase major region subdomain 2 [Penicillium malachiteum]|uniref:Pyridoxal phosphate-dependent transferase major region subdomain 2 n=1 Tax=Penicillium malachiteum TaxID=1324776 RepID=UPI0025495279|nr:Pyridoxal phosphate-dependent transferase major region subdomain 2 [Penicillium malachiteum]KAJ5737093.1 Pyridoxal phosphate-dependent transferase major region subdomain 2 [Penicillium malachiteum]